MKTVESPGERFTRQGGKQRTRLLRHWLVSKLYFRSSCSQDGSH